MQILATGEIVIERTGFIYIYVNNENGQDVYFDNLSVVHTSGPLLEETHYYPYGLTMAGIGAHALKSEDYLANKRRFNGNELQADEFSDGSGLDLYDFNARTYNAQIGRFLQIDPETKDQENFSPYHFGANNPIKFADPNGKRPVPGFAPAIPAIWAALEALGAATGLTVVVMQAVDKVKQVDWTRVMETVGANAPTSGVPFHQKLPGATEVSQTMANKAQPKANGSQQQQKPAAKAQPKAKSAASSNANPEPEKPVKKGDYSHLKEPKKVGEGLETTRAQRKRILEENKRQNGGQLTDDIDGTPLDPPEKFKAGKPANLKQAQVDHIKERSQGGSNSNSNMRVISMEKNLSRPNKNKKPNE